VSQHPARKIGQSDEHRRYAHHPRIAQPEREPLHLLREPYLDDVAPSRATASLERRAVSNSIRIDLVPIPVVGENERSPEEDKYRRDEDLDCLRMLLGHQHAHPERQEQAGESQPQHQNAGWIAKNYTGIRTLRHLEASLREPTHRQ
jgi:hypothetical protein